MNITGWFSSVSMRGDTNWFVNAGSSGAFSVENGSSGTNWYAGVDGSGNLWRHVNFNAANSWSGATSSVGKADPDAITNLQPYYTVFMWKRVS